MFEHRLGLALSRSVGEVRALPYPEYRSWQIYYMLEPWGWHNEEYLAAAQIAMIHNTNVAKTKDAKKPSVYMRDMEKDVLEEIKSPVFVDDEMTETEIESIRAQVKKDFGIN
jgi:hypothetical protein